MIFHNSQFTPTIIISKTYELCCSHGDNTPQAHKCQHPTRQFGLIERIGLPMPPGPYSTADLCVGRATSHMLLSTCHMTYSSSQINNHVTNGVGQAGLLLTSKQSLLVAFKGHSEGMSQFSKYRAQIYQIASNYIIRFGRIAQSPRALNFGISLTEY